MSNKAKFNKSDALARTPPRPAAPPPRPPLPPSHARRHAGGGSALHSPPPPQPPPHSRRTPPPTTTPPPSPPPTPTVALPKARPRARPPTPHAARRSAPPPPPSPLATSQQVHAPSLPAAGTVPATPTHPVPSTHVHHPPAADSPPHTSTAPPHRAYPARQRHWTCANLTRLAAPLAVHQPSLRNRPLPRTRILTAQYHPSTDTFPALYAADPPSSIAQWARADRSRDHPCPRPPHLSCVPPVCNTSLSCGDSHTMWTHNPGLCSLYAVLPKDIRVMPVASCRSH